MTHRRRLFHFLYSCCVLTRTAVAVCYAYGAVPHWPRLFPFTARALRPAVHHQRPTVWALGIHTRCTGSELCLWRRASLAAPLSLTARALRPAVIASAPPYGRFGLTRTASAVRNASCAVPHWTRLSSFSTCSEPRRTVTSPYGGQIAPRVKPVSILRGGDPVVTLAPPRPPSAWPGNETGLKGLSD